jgi:hypothetical protein
VNGQAPGRPPDRQATPDRVEKLRLRSNGVEVSSIPLEPILPPSKAPSTVSLADGRPDLAALQNRKPDLRP